MAVNEAELPAGWTVWHERPDDLCILAYRPDIFDGSEFPAACLPTITIKPARTRGPRGRPNPAEIATSWVTVLTVEPDVEIVRTVGETRSTAINAGIEFSQAFSNGSLDIEGAYTDPHEQYLETLLTRRGSQE